MRRFCSSFISKTPKPKPFCIDCIHYIEYKHKNPYDEIYDKYRIGSCSKFGSQNLVTGEIVYDDALQCRKMYLKCGEDGHYFIPKKE